MSDQEQEQPLDPEQARFLVKVRRLMMIASATTFVAVFAVLTVIGYRFFYMQGSAPAVSVPPGPPVPPAPDVAATLPAGAKILSSAVGEGRIVLTVEIGGGIELRSFDLNTLKPLARMRLSP